MAVFEVGERQFKPGNVLPSLRQSHWSTDGLIGAWLFNEGAGANCYDLTRDPRQVAVSSSSVFVTWDVGPFGRGLNILNSNGHCPQILSAPQGTPAFLDGLNTYSFVWAGNHNGSSGFRGVFETGSWQFTSGGAFFVNTGGDLEHWSSSAQRAASAAGFVLTNQHASYAVTRDAGEYRFFRDGELHSNNSTSYTTPAAYAAAHDNIQILGADATNLYAYGGTHDFFFLYNRTLTDEEARAITASPMIILEPEIAHILFGSAPGNTLVADSGSYSYTGHPADLLWSQRLVADSGSYSYTGYDATLTYSPAQTLVAESGSYAYTGNDADLLISRYMTADSGSYAYTGYDADLSTAKGMTAEPGAYAYTGYDATLTAPNKVMAESGSYGYTGYDVTLISTAQKRWKDLDGDPAGPWNSLAGPAAGPWTDL